MQRLLIIAGALATAAWTLPAAATDITLRADGAWNEFTVDNQVGPAFGTGWIDFANGSPLRFDFTIAAGSVGSLTVVDAGFAGDTYSISNGASLLGQTSAVAVGSTAGPVVFDFDAALGDSRFSHGVFQLAPGSYQITGALAQSVLDDSGAPLDASNGAVRLAVVSAVPEPSTFALLLAGLAAAFVARRRRER